MTTAQVARCTAVQAGRISVTYLPDGAHRTEAVGSFPNSDPGVWRSHPELRGEDGRLLMSLGAFLVETGGQRILVDLAFGPRSVDFGSSDFVGGGLLRSLSGVGLGPQDIDTVIYTHLHLDHVGWTVSRGDLTFPHARHVVHPDEWAYWLDPLRDGGPTAEDLAALPARLDLQDGSAPIAPGVSLVPTPGHTPGHCTVLVASGRDRLMILGDVIHCPLQLSHPDWEFLFDVDPVSATRSRQRMLEELERPDTVGGFAHFPEAAFGRVVQATVPRTWRLATAEGSAGAARPETGPPDTRPPDTGLAEKGHAT